MIIEPDKQVEFIYTNQPRKCGINALIAESVIKQQIGFGGRSRPDSLIAAFSHFNEYSLL